MGDARSDRSLSDLDTTFLLLVLRATVVAVAVVTFLAHAWISDDALITLRSVANAVVGNGPTFNPWEMVQSYSHPLWFLLLVAGSSVFLAPIHWAVGLGILFSLLLLLVVLRAAQGDVLLGATAVLVLISLPAVVEWTTSGLENSLAMLLVATLARIAILPREGRFRPEVLGVVAAALILTRFDLALIAGPLALAWAWRRQPMHIVRAAISGAVPLLMWFAWARYTYGYVLPNTFYAKLNVDIPTHELFIQGVSYLRLGFARHPLMVVVLVSTVLTLTMSRFGLTPASRWGTLAAGTLYILYVIRIGGDFMEGRFLGVVLVLLVVVAMTDIAVRSSGTERNLVAGVGTRAFAGSMAIGVSIALVSGSPVPWQSEALSGERWSYKASGYADVADERGYFIDRGQSFWNGQEIRHLDGLFRGFSVADDLPAAVEVACGGLGLKGLRAGSTVHVIDVCALTDPVLARIAYQERNFRWRAGHYRRPIPDGYIEAVATADLSRIVDPSVRAHVEAVWDVVRR